MAKENQKPQLKVVEALQDDAYKGIARVDPAIMRALGLNRGDLISIKGGRETIAIVDRAYPADVGESIIRIDGILRKNARVGIGDVVSVSPAKFKEAKKVTIAPAQKGIMVQADSDSLRKGLLGRAMVKGDLIVLGGVQRRKDLMNEEFGDLNDIFGNLGDIFGGMGIGGLGGGGITQIKFFVVNTNPNVPVIITENTEVVLNPKAVEISEDKIPDIHYEDIGGLKEEIKKIREMVEIPMKHPEIFQKLGITPPKGVLLHGPPGTGKTLLAKAVANESESNFIQVKGPSLLSMWVGKSEEGVRKIFEKARQVSPCVVFFDEIDSLAGRRGAAAGGGKVTESVLNQMLAEMDGIEDLSNVIIIGATNRPDILDPALLRPGRFDRIVYVDVPDKEGRQQIFEIHTKNMPIKGKKNIIITLSEDTEGYTGADIESLCREAAMLALRENIDSTEVLNRHFTKAMERVSPSVSKHDQEVYRQIEQKYLRSAKAALSEKSNSYLG